MQKDTNFIQGDEQLIQKNWSTSKSAPISSPYLQIKKINEVQIEPIKQDNEMSFFSNIFKKKRGGTTVGNLLRGVSSAATGGILGQGTELAKWEAQQDQIQYDNAVQQAVNQRLQSNTAFQTGAGLSNNTGLTQGVTAGKDQFMQTSTGQAVKQSALKDFFTKNWGYIVGGVSAIGLIVLLLMRGKRGKLV